MTDPAEVSKARARREKFDGNFAWFRTHAPELYEHHRGNFICIAGEEVFAAATPEGALALATASHPGDEGSFVQCIPPEKMARVYADSVVLETSIHLFEKPGYQFRFVGDSPPSPT